MSSPLQILKATKEALERSLHHVQQHGAISSIEEVRHGISTTQMLMDLLESAEKCIPHKQAKEIAYDHAQSINTDTDAYAHGMVDGMHYAYTHLIVAARAQQVIAAGAALREAIEAGNGNAVEQAKAEWDRLQVKPTEHVVTVDQAMEAVERIGVKETTEQGNSRHETGIVSLDPEELRTELTNVNGKA